MNMKVLLYTTSGCHLCEQALVLLQELQPSMGFLIEAVEIADSDDLIEAYGIRIPVIQYANSTDELGWPFNSEQLAAFLTSADRSS